MATKALLQRTKISSLATPKGGVVLITSDETSHQGFKKLIANNILSAPVVDIETGKCTGFLDIRDLVSFVVFVDDDQKSEFPSNLNDLLLHGCKLLKQPSDGVTTTYLSRRNPFHPIREEDYLWSACEILAKGVHRVPIVDANGAIINIISQSTIINFLNKHINEIKVDFTASIQDLNIGTKPVLSVPKNTSAIDTFRLMDNRKISGVAVVDEHGTFIGNTSASDLKLFVKTLSLSILNLPIMDYLKKIRQESLFDDKMPTISVSHKDNLATVIQKLAFTKVHKIFVADDSQGYKPYCVVSITDIIRLVVKK